MDLAIFRGSSYYNPEKKWNNIIYGGAYTKFGLSEDNIRNHRTEAHLGYICKYNFTRNWSIFGDFRLSFMERLFDREWVGAVEAEGFGVDNVLNAQVGILYKFHVRTKEERDSFVRKEQGTDTVVTGVTHFTYVKMEQTYSLSVIDTIIHYEQVNMPTPEMQKKIQDLRDSIDADNARRKNRLVDQPLDSILINQLLPYEMVFFELDKWDILPSEEMKIDKMSRIMKAYPNEKFVLTGSADSKTGTPKRNDFLSHNRADIVYNKLVNEYGIPESQLSRVYLGGILDYKPFYLNRCTVIIMDHPLVEKAFNEMKAAGQAGGGEVKF
jgi:outer membrane protein OmpA-like peptidoglycan-associated protein